MLAQPVVQSTRIRALRLRISVVSFGAMQTKVNPLLSAFDRLFDKAARKLNVDPSPEEKTEATQQFSERFGEAMRLVAAVHLDPFPEAALERMETAIDDLTPAQIASYIASGPLALQVQEIQRTVALRAAQEKLLEHVINQADDTYGGN